MGDTRGDDSTTAERTAHPDERFAGRTHTKALAKPAVLAVLCVALVVASFVYVPSDMAGGWARRGAWIVAAFSVLFYVVMPVLRWRLTVYRLTDTALTVSTGIVERRERRIRLSRVSEVTVQRGLLDRIYGCGTLVIRDASESEPMRFSDIPHVVWVRDTMDALMSPDAGVRP